MGLKSYKKSQRPRCPYCRHAPFRTAKGYNWHLRHMHPDEEYVSVSDVREGLVLDSGGGSGSGSLSKYVKRLTKDKRALFNSMKRDAKRKGRPLTLDDVNRLFEP